MEEKDILANIDRLSSNIADAINQAAAAKFASVVPSQTGPEQQPDKKVDVRIVTSHIKNPA